jgi:predicted aminopeptidase
MASLGGVAALVALAAVVCTTSGCSSFGYIGQSVGGHMDLMHQARPVDDWIADPSTPEPLRRKLALTKRMRQFAVRELHLPDNASYTRYADIGRTAVVWNVVAAPELSLHLKTWCFPVMGCVGYRGYFNKADADALAATLRTHDHLEVDVYGVPAYSTLGWTNWIGGDPLLSTFINWPDGEVARLVFHELAHQVAYAADDTAFNESFAVTVERIGGNRWLALEGDSQALRDFNAVQMRREDFRALTMKTRAALTAVYDAPLSDDDKRHRKAEIFGVMRDDYAKMKAERWGGFAGFDAFIARANNASLAVQGAYNDLVPDFERLFERKDGDFDAFYAEVKRLAALPKAERHATLRAASP